MGRIRTIKPEFFLDERLADLEFESGLPLRLAFAGLWTQADREGRFEWRPRRLKAAILPYDEVDFGSTLEALSEGGFVVRYSPSGGQEPGLFGWIPGFPKHQSINHKESPSRLPEPPQDCSGFERVDDACPTRAGNSPGEGKGKEGKGRERKGREGVASRAPRVPQASQIDLRRELASLDCWHPNSNPMADQEAITAAIDHEPDLAVIVAGARRMAAFHEAEDTPENRRPSLANFLRGKRWTQPWTPTPSKAEQRELRNEAAARAAMGHA